MRRKPRKKSHHRKATHKSAHGQVHRRKKHARKKRASHTASPVQHHAARHGHGRVSAIKAELEKRLERPITVKSLKEVIALRRVQRGAH